MGLAIDRERFEEGDYVSFRRRLDDCLTALTELLARPAFGEGEFSLGAELELSLIDRDARPLPINHRIIAETLDPRVTVELDRFNLECNLRHGMLAGRPFTALGEEIDGAFAEVGRAAALHGGRAVCIGILPTLRETDLQSDAMTQTPRFRALSHALQRLRGEPFEIAIDGEDPLSVTCDDVTFEGAATSLQVHLRIPPRTFRDVFNAAQLATAPVLAVAGNSPLFVGHRLWDETRVALFKQAVDDRSSIQRPHRRSPRVCFGTNWVLDGALDLFASAVHHYEPLLPILADEDPLDCVRAGGIPELGEIRLHQGTVWSWNRPVYDPAAGGHLRIELRALPSGPTTRDMLANIAFAVGLTLGMAPEMRHLIAHVSFDAIHNNFYRAAQYGLGSELAWPRPDGNGVEHLPVRDLIERLIPVARRGLVESGVVTDEADDLLTIIADRSDIGQTGAKWQRDALERASAGRSRNEALAEMLEQYTEHARTGRPVHTWPQGG